MRFRGTVLKPSRSDSERPRWQQGLQIAISRNTFLPCSLRKRAMGCYMSCAPGRESIRLGVLLRKRDYDFLLGCPTWALPLCAQNRPFHLLPLISCRWNHTERGSSTLSSGPGRYKVSALSFRLYSPDCPEFHPRCASAGCGICTSRLKNVVEKSLTVELLCCRQDRPSPCKNWTG